MSENPSNPYVLVVDDTQDNLFVMELMLSPLNLNLIMASSGKEALEKIPESELALILLDVQMPEMDGFELAGHLKSNPKTKDVPIIFATANTSDEALLMQGYECGAVDFLYKPVNDVVLTSKVNTFLELYLQKRKLIDLKDQADQANSAKSEFLSTMSHEIRTPLNGVIGIAELLMDSQLDDEQKQLTEIIHSSGETLLELINDILDFSKIESGEMSFEKIPFDLRRSIEKAMDTVSIKAQEKDLELPLIISHDTPEGVIGDPTRLRQIIVNLVNNAIKFTKEGEVCLNISVKDDEEGKSNLKHVLFEVIDTGIGIPEDKIHKLFKSFSQVEESTTREFGGTGLGLAISKRLSEGMGGSIGVESTEGEGSNFFFSLPFEVASIQTSSYEASSLKHKKIILADANESNLKMYHEILKEVVGELSNVSSGPELLEMLKTCKSSETILMVDLQLPRIDIHRLFEYLKSIEQEDLPVLAITSLPQRGDGKRMKELGARAYLTKPMKKNILLQSLSQVDQVSSGKEQKQLITKHSLEEHLHHQKAKILLAEDNRTNQILFIKLLKKEGLSCDLAHNGQEAFEAAKHQVYDLIFMDINMPVLDGTSAMKKIKVETETNSTKIIAATADCRKGEFEKLIEDGFDDVISKPITVSSLKSLLQKYLKAE